jgi:cell wall-associated NlpC family hydrolase
MPPTAPATAALTSVALLPQTAGTAPAAHGDRPSLEEVEKKLDDLYRRADAAGEKAADEKYDTPWELPAKQRPAKQRGTGQRGRVAALLDDVARRTDMLNKARGILGSFAAAPSRADAEAPEAAALQLADAPEGYFDRDQLMSRLVARRQGRPADTGAPLPVSTRNRQEAPRNPREAPRNLASQPEQHDIRAAKITVQRKLAAARALLLERTAADTAGRGATDPASLPPAQPVPSVPSVPSEAPASGSSYATKAEKALAFARAQTGKPYVWGAAGPGSYDCSGLTQAAWKAAGVALPRATHDQVGAGTTVPLPEALPGDLVFFHDDLSHVGIHVGDGMMIHAPQPGAYVREESIHLWGESAIHRVVRPA